MNKELIYDSETGKLLTLNEDPFFQNRDIIKWMDRIKRGEAFFDDATKVMGIIDDVLNNVASKYFIGSWKSNFETHQAPNGLKIIPNVMAPKINKEHEEGDEDKYFIYFKEYPFFYTFNLTDTFCINPVDERMAANEDYYKQFYLATVAPQVESDICAILEARIKREVDTDVFHFPKKNEEMLLNKINVKLSTSLKLNNANEENAPSTAMTNIRAKLAGGDSLQSFISPEDIRDAITREVSIGMGRLTPIEKLEQKQQSEKAK